MFDENCKLDVGLGIDQGPAAGVHSAADLEDEETHMREEI